MHVPAKSEIRESSAMSAGAAGQYDHGQTTGETIVVTGGKGMSTQVLSESSTQQTTQTSTQRTTKTSTQQTVETLAQQTLQASTASIEGKIGESTNNMTFAESNYQYGAQVDTMLTSGQSIRESITEEAVRDSIEANQSSTHSQLTTQTGGRINDIIVTAGGTTAYDINRGPEIYRTGSQAFIGEQESDAKGDKFLSSIGQKVMETAKETVSSLLGSVQTGTISAEVCDFSSKEIFQSLIQQTSTHTETAVQLTVTESKQLGCEQSLDQVSSSAQNLSISEMQETVQGTTVEVLGNANQTNQIVAVDETFNSLRATEVIIHASEISKISQPIVYLTDHPIAAESKTGELSATVTESAGQYGGQATSEITEVSGGESMSTQGLTRP